MSNVTEEGQAVPFSFAAFATVIETVKGAGYAFRRFDSDNLQDDQLFFLRHDVDISPTCARKVGEIEHSKGVVANFFFQINADTYNVFDQATLDTVGSLRDLGHCVGLHIDENLWRDDEQHIGRTIDWFDRCIAPIDRVVSFHRPTPAVLGRDFKSFINTYAPRFFSNEIYLADSRRDMGFWPILEGWLRARRPRIQLLLHPVWWHPHETAEEIWQELRARREHELKRYLLKSCRKVFADVVSEDSSQQYNV